MSFPKITTIFCGLSKTIRAIYQRHIRASSLLIPVACDADLCATCPEAQEIRKKMTVKTAREIHMEMQKTSHKNEVL